MKGLVVLFLVVFAIGSVNAREALLEDAYNHFRQRYSEIGQDNNEIVKEDFSTSSITNINELLGNKKIIRLTSSSEQMKYLKQCLFIKKGAYGDHINQSQQEYLSHAFIQFLNDWYIHTPDMYVVFDIELEMINNRCALLLSSLLNDEGMLLQGVGWD